MIKNFTVTMEQFINIDFLTNLRDPERMIEWCMKIGLISNRYTCPKCGENMKKNKRSDVCDKYMWRCTKGGHDVKRSMRKGSWFDESTLSMSDILLITYFWIMKVSGDFIAVDRRIRPATVVDWKRFCREVCIDACIRDNEIVGGEGVTVEINESKFEKRKFQRGKLIDGKWVFGGIERGTDKCFMVVVPEGSRDVLMNVIFENVRPGSTIISNCWRTYNCLEDERFVHLISNYGYKFKNPERENSINSTWFAVKGHLRNSYCKNTFDSYLFEYMWRQKHKNNKDKLMYLFLQAVSQSYPPANCD